MAYQPHIVAAPNEFKLSYPSHVSVSKVQFCKDVGSRLLVVSGWDGTVRIFDVANVGHADEKRFYFHGQPVLACTFAGSSKVASAGLDKLVKLVDIETGKEHNMGSHTDSVRCMEYNPVGGVIVSGGWDSSIKIWDARTGAGGALQSTTVSDKVFAMDVHNDSVVVGTRDKKIILLDMRNLATPLQVRDSPLKYQTRAVSFFPSGDSFVVSSIEGRVAVEYVDLEMQKKKYAFKCHRNKDESGVECIYPVNAIAFHPRFGTFATGGSDHMVNIWDPVNRKRLVQLHAFPTTIPSMSFNFDGTQLAIASSYGYELDTPPQPLPLNEITIRQISDAESRPKT